ncbi:FIVAR domain-containing protein [Desulfosporosinus sp. FKB]|uniref:FIVAR domain-containing protein n=1 Tax=Desulfosporosinus sp. FKB TaxID=1969835 RepID=UPI000B4A00EE|nr:FIVAR domain-containing protein [Desulfosporosinus sp. FKB]
MLSSGLKVKIALFTMNLLLLNGVPIQSAQAQTIGSGNIRYMANDLGKSNKSASAKVIALSAINSGKEDFSDFKTAGVTQAIKANKAEYDSAIASALKIKGSSLTLSEVQKTVDSANKTAAANALLSINAGTEVFDDFASAGVTKAVKANKANYDSAIAAAFKIKGSRLTLNEVQNTVNSVNTTIVADALSAINSGTELFEDFTKAGITKAVKANKAEYDAAIADAKEIKGLNLTLVEVRKIVESTNTSNVETALSAINAGSETFPDFAMAGVKNAVKGNKAGYDSAISDALRIKGTSLTTAEVQKAVDSINAKAAAAALAAINKGTEDFSDFAIAGIKNALKANKAGYDSAIADDQRTKGSDLNLKEVQKTIEKVNEAVAAAGLTAINGGTEIFTDFSTAGVKKAIKTSKSEYDTAIASALKKKGTSLSLAEVQEAVDNVNAAAASSALASINAGTEIFSNFATAGITKAAEANKERYDLAIATERGKRCSMLELANVQEIVDEVNITAPWSALLLINGGLESFDDFATAGIKDAFSKNKAQYDAAIQAARESNGPPLTKSEVQTQVDKVNKAAAVVALNLINEGTKDFSNYAMAGVKGAIGALKRFYDTEIITDINKKGSNLTLNEVQAAVDNVNARAATALAAINEGTELYNDFSIAGVTKAIITDKEKYDSAIAKALKTKGSDLTLDEVQKTVNSVNATTVPPRSLQLINDGTEQFSDFALAGIKGAVGRYKGNYDKAIVAAKSVKGSELLLEEIQKLVDDVNKILSNAKNGSYMTND